MDLIISAAPCCRSDLLLVLGVPFWRRHDRFQPQYFSSSAEGGIIHSQSLTDALVIIVVVVVPVLIRLMIILMSMIVIIIYRWGPNFVRDNFQGGKYA